MIKTVWSITFHVSNLENAEKIYKELHEEPWGGKQATFTDPDGNILEIAQINWKKYFTVSAEGADRKS